MIDNISIFFGRVEDVNDPMQLGRVRVRVYGLHTENKSLIPTSSLPWSHVSTDVQNSAIAGLGWSPTGVVEGSTVWGFFLDKEKLEPFVVGAYHGLNAGSDHDVNPLARGIATAISAAKGLFSASGVGVKAPTNNDSSSGSSGQGSSGSNVLGGSSGASSEVSERQIQQLSTVKLSPEQIAQIRAVCGSNEGKFNFLCNVLTIENRGKPAPTNAVSPAGAAGPYQIMPATAKALGLQGVGTSTDERNVFSRATVAVSGLYDDLENRYGGNRPAMYADYNGGPKFGKAVLAGQEVQNTENREYVAMAKYLEENGGLKAGQAARQDEELYDPTVWMDIAQGEIGVKEYSGSQNNNPRVLEYHAETSLNASNDETPWCSAFACWVMKKAGFQGTRSALARSWLSWGSALNGPKFGAIVITSRGNNPRQGHVGFVSRFDANTVWILGGNQRDEVNVTAFKRSSVIGYRYPGPTQETELVEEASFGSEWSEPSGGVSSEGEESGASVQGGPYPWNRVYQSRSGHVFEIDDSPNNARLHWFHTSGTFREILNEGTLTDKSVQDRYEITNFDSYGLIGNNLKITVNGTAYYRFKGVGVVHSDSTLFLEGGSRVQLNAPVVACKDQLAAPSASFDELDVKSVIEGTCKNAIWAAQAGSLGGNAQAVINKNINTAMQASIKAAQDASTDNFSASFGKAPPSALTSREGDIWVPTGEGEQKGQQKLQNGEWVPDNTSKVRLSPSANGEDGQPVYYLPENDKPVTVKVSSAEPILEESEKEDGNQLWVNRLTGAVKKWAPVALAWLPVAMTAKVFSDDTNNVGGQPAGVVASKAIDGYEKAVQALTALSTTAEAMDGQVKTFFSDTEPGQDMNPSIGDWWYDTSNGMKAHALKFVDGAPRWIRDEGSLGVLLKNLTGLKTGKSTTFMQSEDPKEDVSVKLVEGDVWFHSTERLIRRWDGSSWVLVRSSGDTIEGGTIKNAGLTTNANETEERLEINSSTNSQVYYGEDSNGDVTELARIGGTGSGATSVQKLGATSSDLVALELESSETAMKVTGASEFNGPVEMKDALTTTKPIKAGPHVMGSGTPPAASQYAYHIMTFRTTASPPVVTVCYSDGVNWRKVKDDTVFI